MWSYIVNTMEPKVREWNVGLWNWEKIVQGLEVSAVLQFFDYNMQYLLCDCLTGGIQYCVNCMMMNML